MQPTSSIYPSEPPVDRIRFNNNNNTNNNNNNNSNNYQQSFQIQQQQQQPPYHSLQHSLSTPVTAYSSRPPVYNSNSINNSNTGMRDESSFYTNMSSSNNNNNYNNHQYTNNNNNNNNVPQWQPHMNSQYNHSQSQSLPPQYNQTTTRSNRAMSIPTPYHSHPNNHNHNGQHQFNHGGNIGHISPTDSASSSSVPLSPPQSAPVKSRAPRFIDTFQARILKQEINVNSDGEATTTVKAKRKRRTPVLDPTTKLVRSQKHNEAEVRRRQRLNNLLLELAELVQCKKPQKSAILRITIEKCRQWQTKIQQLEEKLEKYEAKDNNQFINNSTATAMTDNNNHSDSIDNNNNVSVSINVNTQSQLQSQSLSSMSMSLADSSSTSNSFISSSSSLTSNTFDSLSGISNSSPIPIIQSLTTLFPSNHNTFNNNDNNHIINDGQNLPMSFTVKEEPNSLTDSINLSMRNYSMSSHNNENIINSGAIGNISSSNNSNIIVINDHDNILPSLPPLLDTTTSSSLLTNTISSSPLITSHNYSSSSLHRVIDLMHDATVAMDLVDLNGRILDCNQLFADFTGYTKSELFDPHATFFNLTHPDSLNASFSLLSSLITANHSVGRTMKKYVHKSGKTITALLTAFMVNDHQGQANCVCTIFEPVEADLQGM